MDCIQSCSLLGVIRQKLPILNQHQDEDVVSTVACTVETTIDACAMLCGVSTLTTSQKKRCHCHIPMTKAYILPAD
jgi:hypothetical protein